MVRTRFLVIILSPFVAGLFAYIYMDNKFHILDYFTEALDKKVFNKESTITDSVENNSKIFKKVPVESKQKLENKPKFDIIQTSPDGQLVIAGKAGAKSNIELIINGKKVDSLIGDDNGEFVFIVEDNISFGAYDIQLKEINKEGLVSYSNNATTIIPKKTKDGSATLIYDENNEIKEVIQNNRVIEKSNGLILSTITFNNENFMFLNGKGKKGAKIFIYVDNILIEKTFVSNQADWKVRKKTNIREGNHVLRLDQTFQNKVISRIETSFVKFSNVGNIIEGGTVIINYGDTLWDIARNIYGKGIQYTSIFRANIKNIKDPNLIYPGQIFIIPDKSK